MIKLNGITLFYGSQPIFDNITCSLSPHARIGLVGRNGSGKSTLLKALAGDLMLDDGTINIGKMKIAYLPQDIVLLSQKSVLEEAGAEFEQLEPEELPAMMVEVKKVLMGLGFSLEQLDKPVPQLSTGWKMRLVLAKLLLQKADFYLFDEPTNHLDIFAQEWFLEFLKRAPFGFLLVCHERAFLNKVCTDILELHKGKGTLYKGNYDHFLQQKEEIRARLKAAHHLQQKEMTRMRETAEKFRASASKASFAQSLFRKLEKMEIIEVPEDDTSSVKMAFPTVTRSGKQVLTVRGIGKSFNNQPIFRNVNFEIERDMKVALVAANGVGKTTLLRIITGEVQAEQGHFEFGTNVIHAIFKQNQHEILDPKVTIWEQVLNTPVRKSEGELRRMLGAFLFSGESIYKKTGVLSGGEKNRLCMALTLLQDSNFLILDEPTNHLDIPSKDILLTALKAYPGTLLFVSHDQDFVSKLATHILELTPTGAIMYKGSFDDYIEQKKYREGRGQSAPAQESSAIHTAAPVSQLDNTQRFELQKKARRVEEKVEKLQQKQDFLCKKLEACQPGTPQYTMMLGEINLSQKTIDAATKEWEEFIEQLK
jgi:ATP-binding cassette subfamily F protein 3